MALHELIPIAINIVLAASPMFPAFADDELDALMEIADEAFRPVTRPLDRPVFLHSKALKVTPESLNGGWVRNYQCHRHFATTPALEIVFPAGAIRDIEIVESSALGHVQVDGPTVLLEGVQGNSTLCFRSENRLLETADAGAYRLRAGPFFHRFLDGYFPMDVELTVTFPGPVEVLHVSPPAAPGIDVTISDRKLTLRSRFEGTLWVEILFRKRTESGS